MLILIVVPSAESLLKLLVYVVFPALNVSVRPARSTCSPPAFSASTRFVISRFGFSGLYTFTTLRSEALTVNSRRQSLLLYILK